MRFNLSLVFISFISIHAGAGELAANATAPETIVVTGTRTAKMLYNSPVKVDVIAQETIARLSQGTLKQLLDIMPGVVVSRSMKDGYTVQLQGFAADRVLVLMDGKPLVAPTGSAVDLDQISVNNIKQIEIVRGGASVLYGSSAMGGVINIITQSPEASQVKLTYQLSSYLDNAIDDDEIGQLFRLQADHSIAKWQTSLNVQYIDDPGFDYDPSSVAQSGGAVDKTFIHLDLSRQFDAIKFSTKSRWFEEQKDKAISTLPGQTSLLRYLSDVRQWQQDVDLVIDKDWQVSARALGHEETSGYSNALRDTHILLSEIDAQKVWQGDYEWIVGTVLHQDKLDQVNLATNSTEVDDAQRESVETYAQVNITQQTRQWLLGSRLQYDSDFDWHQAWRGSVSQQWQSDQVDWQMRMGLGQSYRVPNLKERYYIFDHSNLGYMIIGDETLEPETAKNLNIGLQIRPKWQSQWQVTGDISAHYTRAKQFITTSLDADLSQEAGLDVYVYENIDQATISGLDFALDMKNDSQSWQLNYSYTHAVDGDEQRLSERPRHLIKASYTQQFTAFDADLQIYAVSTFDEAPDSSYDGVYKDDTHTLNAQFRMNFTAHFNAQLGIENIFDEHQNSQAVAQGLFDARDLTSRRLTLGISYTL
ncbi:TonB-dependent receptor [Alteromonas sp. C1M14]|uniref:TonB-dependent receptor plug domain-containing protein n=1 Tax=Alteromonas sp. C1M14 TaxID=2841567 RepID=UPI001C08BA64|nr:TonB-dependent receptor [Alteromonas sp. C1M14]MBU2979791.1 TonB-dependent receptor [Alteromonas sp. C1M14]